MNMNGRKGMNQGPRAGCASWGERMRVARFRNAIRGLILQGLVAGAAVGLAAPVSAQSLDELDYENLSLRGLTLDWGQIRSGRVASTSSLGVRLDLGFLGPGVRVVLGGSQWSSRLKDAEVREFEEKLEDLIEGETGDRPTVRLGDITWSNVAISTDAHLVWRVPGGALTYLGAGGTAHVLRGGGSSIEGTFIEDLLNTIRAGINAHAGVEIPIHDRFRLMGESRVELVQGASYVQLRLGGGYLWGGLAPGERR